MLASYTLFSPYLPEGTVTLKKKKKKKKKKKPCLMRNKGKEKET